jgi:hypothetical protein
MYLGKGEYTWKKVGVVTGALFNPVAGWVYVQLHICTLLQLHIATSTQSHIVTV